jgi:hypothetical protein
MPVLGSLLGVNRTLPTLCNSAGSREEGVLLLHLFLLFTPVERVEVFCELRTSEKLINVRFHGQLGLPSWYRPLADSYQLTLDASTITLVLIPTRS